MYGCKYCGNSCIRKGWQCQRQKLFCKTCCKHQQFTYSERKLTTKHERDAVFLNNEGCSVSSISRIIGFSKTTVCNIIDRLGILIQLIPPVESNQDYEVDELKTFVGNKKNESWIMYSLNKATKKIISFCVGRRTKENIRKITDSLIKLSPKSIRTDKLNIYPALIPKEIHKYKNKVTNHIERKNLHFRQQLRRLQRKTICYSKSERMLRNSIALFVFSLTKQ
ncbi:IS1-like element ISYps7 family transposase [soil metagenome]